MPLFQMFTSSAKIIKSGKAEPDAFESSISQALLELEMNSDLKAQLRELYITKAREIEINGKKVRYTGLQQQWHDPAKSVDDCN
jgi:hypothetical protein